MRAACLPLWSLQLPPQTTGPLHPYPSFSRKLSSSPLLLLLINTPHLGSKSSKSCSSRTSYEQRKTYDALMDDTRQTLLFGKYSLRPSYVPDTVFVVTRPRYAGIRRANKSQLFSQNVFMLNLTCWWSLRVKNKKSPCSIWRSTALDIMSPCRCYHHSLIHLLIYAFSYLEKTQAVRVLCQTVGKGLESWDKQAVWPSTLDAWSPSFSSVFSWH